MLSLACCTAVALVKSRTAPLVAVYAGEPWGLPTRPATEEMLMIDPLPARRIAGSACLVPKKTPLILTAMIWSRSSTRTRAPVGQGRPCAEACPYLQQHARTKQRPWGSAGDDDRRQGE